MITIDAGHGIPCLLGGKQSPPLDDGEIIHEANINRQIVTDLIELNDYQFDLINITPTIKDISLLERKRRINALGPDFHVSVHFNGVGYGDKWHNDAEGAETWYYYKSENSKALAKLFQRHISEGVSDRGIKGAYSPHWKTRIYLTRETVCPTVLLELEFFTNKQVVEEKILDKEWMRCRAEMILNAIKEYYG